MNKIEQEAKAVLVKIEDAEKAAVKGIETWYAEHFHAGVTKGSPTLSSNDKAALVKHVQDSVKSVATPSAKQ
jgi:hypothetical protein